MEMTMLHALQEIHSPVLDTIMVYITALGEYGILWILIAIILITQPKYRQCGVAMLLAMLCGYLIGNVGLKNLIARPRPCWIDDSISLLVKNPTDYSFPSGHTLASFESATVIFLYSKKAGVIAYITAVLIAFSRLYLFVHYPSDVLAGMILGIGIAVVADKLFKKLTARTLRRS